MTATLVDSNIILDLLTEDASWAERSAHALSKCADEGTLLINPLIYAEVSVGFARIEDVDAALNPAIFVRHALPYEAAFLAGQAFRAYRRRSGTRTSPLPDFYIGAHAAIAGVRLLTRDAARYRTYFPALDLVTP